MIPGARTELLVSYFIQICEKHGGNGLSLMALQMIPVIIRSHEDAALGAAKCLLLRFRVKARFLIWICSERLKKRQTEELWAENHQLLVSFRL